MQQKSISMTALRLAGALMQALKGPEGSRVTIGIKTMSREGAKEATVEVVRMSVSLEPTSVD
jgi:C-terminal processing protease CtpA/Prc